jgi:hypothetical protein
MCNATYWRKLDTRYSFQPGIENFQPFLQNQIHHQHNSLNTSDTFPGAVGDTRASTLLQQSSTSCISFMSRPPILHWWQRNQRKTYTINHQAKIKDMSKAVECEFAALNGTDCWSVIMTFLLSVLKCSLELPWWRKVWYMLGQRNDKLHPPGQAATSSVYVISHQHWSITNMLI